MTLSTRSVNTRAYRRVSFKRPVKVAAAGQEEFQGNISQDLSEGGLRVFSTDFVPLHAVVDVKVQLGPEAKVLELKAKVAWVRVMPLSENFQLGLEFVGDKVKTTQEIARFVKAA